MGAILWQLIGILVRFFSSTMALSFTVAPKNPAEEILLGSDESGKIKIVKKGYITVGEQAFMAQAEANDESVGLVMALSRKVAKHHKTDLMTAYDSVTATITGRPSKLKLNDNFVDECNNVTTELIAAEARKNVMKAWCLVLYRIDSNIEVAEVMNMHPDLLQALVDLYQEEESGSVEGLKKELGDNEGSAEAEDLAKK